MDIYDLLLGTCGREFLRERVYIGGTAFDPRDFRSTTPHQTCGLSFYHPEMQETLLSSAAEAGAVVRRGAIVTGLLPGPVVNYDWDGNVHSISARLVVGADGRESRCASLLGLSHDRDDPELFTGGLQFKGDIEIDQALHFFLHEAGGRGSIVVSNRPGNFRAYLLHHKDALPKLLSGARDYEKVKLHFWDVGWSAEWLDSLEPHGTFATFDGAHRWTIGETPDGYVLVGDALAVSDPVWGNGLSRTLRDVRLLRDRLIEARDWREAAKRFVDDHRDFFGRLRRAERLNAKLYFAIGEDANARRLRAFDLMDRYPELSLDVLGKGPDIENLDEAERVLLGS